MRMHYTCTLLHRSLYGRGYAWEWKQLGSSPMGIPTGMGVTMTIMGMVVGIKVWQWE